MAYLMAGDPDLKRFPALLLALQEGGADVVEVGLPFSDPIADGPTIQAAAARALAKGATLEGCLQAVEKARTRGFDRPLVAMTYANVAYAREWHGFARRIRSAGFSGCLIPDLPPDSDEGALAELRRGGLDTVLLLSPATDETRARLIASRASGFLYLVGTYGTTGARRSLAQDTKRLVRRMHPVAVEAGLPLAVGFGISKPEHVAAVLTSGADGAVVGSALVERVGKGAGPEAVKRAVRQLAKATHLRR